VSLAGSEAVVELKRTIIFAKDLARMEAFYRDGLGLRPMPERAQDGWVELDAGACSLALHAIPRPLAERISITDPPRAREDSAIKLTFVASDVAAARAHLTAHGAVMGPLRPWGGCDGTDPEGNVFQIVAPDLGP
jgi:catechol 2,3-dioxygenase-like lactoylglutathione lyase family enzyme